uniref:Uncharacterized protein n=1 Tax=Manihot esculenta TaxID=3983 RepID=A0A2C9UR80_MANES
MLEYSFQQTHLNFPLNPVDTIASLSSFTFWYLSSIGTYPRGYRKDTFPSPSLSNAKKQ